MELSKFILGSSPNSDGIWDPFSSIHEQLLDPLDTFSSNFDQKLFKTGGTTLDWVETPDSLFFSADLPAGMSKEDITIKVLDGRVLSISGEKKKGVVQQKDSWKCVERSSGKFRWQLGIPKDSMVENVVANADNGVLTVTIPKMHSTGEKSKLTPCIDTSPEGSLSN